jgi:hypothetical protein
VIWAKPGLPISMQNWVKNCVQIYKFGGEMADISALSRNLLFSLQLKEKKREN